jgi:hypothetical protein
MPPRIGVNRFSTAGTNRQARPVPIVQTAVAAANDRGKTRRMPHTPV